MFVRKRDPRYKSYLARQAQSPGATPMPTSGTVTPKKTAPKKNAFVAQDWQRVAEPSDGAADLEWARAEGAEDEEWECIACHKTFRSEAAWNSHERSKKHLRAVEQLKREMQNEELELELGHCQDGGEFADADVRDHENEEGDQGSAPGADNIVEDYTDKEHPEATPDREASAPTPKEGGNTAEGKEEEEFAPRPGRQKRAKKKATPSPSLTPPVPKTSQDGQTCATGERRSSPPQQSLSDLVFSKDNLEASILEESRSYQHDGNSDDIVKEDDAAAASAATSTKGELSKREKRRAREAAKKAREGEAKNGCAVSSFPHPNSIQSVTGSNPTFAPLSFGLSRPCWSFLHNQQTDLSPFVYSATFVERRLRAEPSYLNISTGRVMLRSHIHVTVIHQRRRERRRSGSVHSHR
jgi:DnaJ homolog subfamily A member 5